MSLVIPKRGFGAAEAPPWGVRNAPVVQRALSDRPSLLTNETLVSDGAYNAYGSVLYHAESRQWLIAWISSPDHFIGGDVKLITSHDLVTWSSPRTILAGGATYKWISAQLCALPSGAIGMALCKRKWGENYSSWILWAESQDAGETWSDPQTIFGGNYADQLGGRPLVTAAGSVLLPSYLSTDGTANTYDSYIHKRPAGSSSWATTKVAGATVNALPCGETTPVQHPDGTIVLMIRREVATKFIRVTSTDDGATYSTPVELTITQTNPGWPASMVDPAGSQWMLTRFTDAQMALLQSSDKGQTWTHAFAPFFYASPFGNPAYIQGSLHRAAANGIVMVTWHEYSSARCDMHVSVWASGRAALTVPAVSVAEPSPRHAIEPAGIPLGDVASLPKLGSSSVQLVAGVTEPVGIDVAGSRALQLGSSKYLTGGAPSDWIFLHTSGGPSMALYARVYFPAASTAPFVIVDTASTDAGLPASGLGTGFYLGIDATGAVQCVVRNGLDIAQQILAFDRPIVRDQWLVLGIVYDGTAFKLFGEDAGRRVAWSPILEGKARTTANPQHPISIGRAGSDGLGGTFYLSHLYLFDVLPSDAQRLAIQRRLLAL